MTILNESTTAGKSPAEIASRILASSPYHPIRFLTCTFDDGVLTLGGRLPSFHLKQVAHNAVQGIEGVLYVEDRLEVAV